MYQSVIRDPGGSSLVRIQSDVCAVSPIVNGSILLVPPGTHAVVACNGALSRPYGPGRWALFSGVDPFFVRLRNIMTQGDPGISVSVFFVSTEKRQCFRLGTGEFPFAETRFHLTLQAMAACSLTYSIADPMLLLKKLVGTYTSSFSEEDIEPFMQQLVLPHVREALSRELGTLSITSFNSNLSRIAAAAAADIRPGLAAYGLRLEAFSVLSITISDEEKKRLDAREDQQATGLTATDLELDHLKRVWNGDVRTRSLFEGVTGFPSRGQASAPGAPAAPGGGMGPLLQMAMLSQVLPAFRQSLDDMLQHTDTLRPDARGRSSSGVNTNAAPPPLPGQRKRCPSCSSLIARSATACPVCGFRFRSDT